MGDETQTYRPIYDTRASDGAVYADNAVVGVTLDGVFTSKAEQDDWGRVTKKNLTTTGSTTPLLSEEYSYLDVAAGFETRLTTMVQLLTRKAKGVTKDTLRYTYDNNGNITAIRNGPGTEYYAKYTYDGLNQLTREDNAVLGKLNEVRIIHGKGTGAVRKAVRDHLKRSRYVKSFRPGRYGEGEDGVTIAELR